MNEIIGLIIATILSWLNFVLNDAYLGLGERPGVLGAKNVAESVVKRGGDISGSYFLGNILCSLDASAGTLLSAIGYFILGIPGALIAVLLIYIGNRLCADPGFPGTIGALSMIIVIYLSSFINIYPEMFIVGFVIAITTVQGIDHPSISKILGKIASVIRNV